MSVFKDIGRAASRPFRKLGKRLTTGKGVLARKGVGGLLVRGKVGKAAKLAAHSTSKLLQNPVIQASFPIVTVPAGVLTATIAHGPKGAMQALKSVASNPLIKAELAAAAVVFPPAAPASALGIAAMEAGSRVVDGINSKDPKKVAAAAVQVAGTKLLAGQGNADAKRALTVMKDLSSARKLAGGKNRGLFQQITAAAKAGDKKAKKRLDLVQFVAVRRAGQVANSTTAKPAQKQAAGKLIAKAQLKKPGLTVGTLTALSSPKGVRIGDFSLLSTGRILYQGRPVRKHRAA